VSIKFKTQRVKYLLTDIGGGNVQTFTFAQKNATYVNLELLKAQGLIRHDVPICNQTTPTQSTLDILFNDHGSYARAKQHWQGRKDLLFVIEDASCLEGEGTRSIYL
jgi:hypothetical protein